jgi:hypothetical protein
MNEKEPQVVLIIVGNDKVNREAMSEGKGKGKKNVREHMLGQRKSP